MHVILLMCRMLPVRSRLCSALYLSVAGVQHRRSDTRGTDAIAGPSLSVKHDSVQGRVCQDVYSALAKTANLGNNHSKGSTSNVEGVMRSSFLTQPVLCCSASTHSHSQQRALPAYTASVHRAA